MEFYSFEEKKATRKTIHQKLKKSKKIHQKEEKKPKTPKILNEADTNRVEHKEEKKSNSYRISNHKIKSKIIFKNLILLFQIFLFLFLVSPIITDDAGDGTPEETPAEPDIADSRIKEDQEIVIKVKNSGNPQYLIFPGFTNRPKYFCGGEELTENEDKKVTISEGQDTITLKWEYLFEDMKALFANV